MKAITFSHAFDTPVVVYPKAAAGQTCGLKVGETFYAFDTQANQWSRQALGEDPVDFLPDAVSVLIPHVCPHPKTNSVTIFGTTFVAIHACAKVGPSNWICG